MSLSRRELLKTSAFAIAGTAIGLDDAKSSAAAQAPASAVGRWGVFETSCRGPENGNPYVDVEFSRAAERFR